MKPSKHPLMLCVRPALSLGARPFWRDGVSRPIPTAQAEDPGGTMSDRRFASMSPPASQATPGSICFARTGKKAKVAGLTTGLTLHGPFRVWGGGHEGRHPSRLGGEKPCLCRDSVLGFSHPCSQHRGQGGPAPHRRPRFSSQACGVLGPCQTMTLSPPFLCWRKMRPSKESVK